MFSKRYGLFSDLRTTGNGLEAIDTVCRPYEKQYYQNGRKVWFVKRLHELCKDLPVLEMRLEDLDLTHIVTPAYTLPQMAMHVKLVMNADLNYPILLGQAGNIMDGRHRIVLSILKEKETIKYQQFDEDPTPDYLTDET